MYYINTLKRELVDTNAYKLQPSLSERVIVDGHGCHTALHFGVKAKENQDKVHTLYWLPKLHKKPYKARFIANSSSCITTELSKLLTSCLTAVKKHVIKYCEKVYERSGKNLFWSIKNSGEILDKLKARDFNATSLSTNCASLVADLFLFCYERDFMMSLSDNKQADVIDAFNTTSRYLDDILNINNVF